MSRSRNINFRCILFEARAVTEALQWRQGRQCHGSDRHQDVMVMAMDVSAKLEMSQMLEHFCDLGNLLLMIATYFFCIN